MDSAPPVPVGGNPEGAAGPGLGLRSGRAIAQPHGAPALDAAAFEALSDAQIRCTEIGVQFLRTVTRVRQVVVRHVWALASFFFEIYCPCGSSGHSQRSYPGKEGRI